MFIRFVIGDLDRDSGRRQGLFQAGDELLSSGRMGSDDAERLQAAYRWFKTNLPVPMRFSLSARPNAKAQALNWSRYLARAHPAHA